MLTAFGTVVASITALVTALYTAGVIGHKASPAPAPAPVTQGTGTAGTNANSMPPAASGDSQTAEWRAAVDAVDPGQYGLHGYEVNGRQQPATGTLMLQKQPNGDFHFHTQVTTAGAGHFYQGMIWYRNGVWHQQTKDSNDPTVNKTPVVVTLTKQNGMLVVKNPAGVEADWLKQ
jgi:hypothetical protein